MHELEKCRWHVVGVAETQWIGRGEIEKDGIKIVYSGRENGIHRE